MHQRRGGRVALTLLAVTMLVFASAGAANAGGTGTTTNFTYTPTRLSFGGISVADVSKKSVSFTNTSAVTMHMDSDGFANGLYFVLGPDNGNTGSCAAVSFLLPAGNTCWIEVMFEPGPKGHFTDTFTTDWYPDGSCCTITDHTTTALGGSAH